MTLGETKSKMAQAVTHFKEELSHIRTGRADPTMLQHVRVEVYGTQMRLNDLASVTTPDPRQLLITAYDINNLGAIRKGIEKANLNLQPQIDGNIIRINIAEMDESVRKEMVKQAKKKGEEAKVSIRNARRDENEQLKKMKSSGEIAEDIQKKHENEIQKLTDQFCKEVDEICSRKEKEILVI